MLSKFCTLLGDSEDTALYNHILANVRAIVADGALQKVAALLRQSSMPNVILIQRDPAHFIRIAFKEPGGFALAVSSNSTPGCSAAKMRC